MDPNEALREIRRLAQVVMESTDTGEHEDAADTLAEQVLALDNWLSSGGFPPEVWREGPDAYPADVYAVEPLGGPTPGVDGSHPPEDAEGLMDLVDDTLAGDAPVTLPPPYDRRCATCGAIGGHRVECPEESRADELRPVYAVEAEPGEWVVSQGWEWFPGVYATRDAAELAGVLNDHEQIQLLWFSQPPKHRKPLTVAELRATTGVRP